MKITCLFKPFVASILMVFGTKITCGQARNGVGFMYGFNKPFSDRYNGGHGFKLIGSIALTPQMALTPYLGYEYLKGDGSPVYGQKEHPNNANGRVQNADVIKIGTDAKYYFNRQLFAQAGAMAYVAGGNEDLINLGLGGSAAVGVSLPVD